MKMKNLLMIVAILVLGMLLVGCGNQTTEQPKPSEQVTNTSEEQVEAENATTLYKPNRDENRYADVTENPVVTIEMEDGSIIKAELYPQIAPETVENFISLANSGFYDGVIFHRVIPGFMIQGGDPEGYGIGGPKYSIYGEFKNNGYEKNNIAHERGVLSMARGDEMNSAGSQFFIMVAEADYLDGAYAAFGRVLEGMEKVDEIVNLPIVRKEVDIKSVTNEEEYMEYIRQRLEIDRPVNPPVMKKVSVETFGVEYEAPTKLAEEE